jgi:hypothetical protein
MPFYNVSWVNCMDKYLCGIQLDKFALKLCLFLRFLSCNVFTVATCGKNKDSIAGSEDFL